MAKPALPVEEQIKLLKLRNLIFEDENKVKLFLLKANYYRLNGYWRRYHINPEKKNDNFKQGTTFEQITNLYDLDAQLRNLLRKGIEIFELCFRTRFAYYMAISDPTRENGQYLYLEQSSYEEINTSGKNTSKTSKKIKKHEELTKKIKSEINKKIENSELLDDEIIKEIEENFEDSYNAQVRTPNKNLKGYIETIESEIERSSKEKPIKHYKNKAQKIPIWVAVEVLSFGTISKMYSKWKDKKVKEQVSNSFEIFKNYTNAKDIIKTLSYLRNLCAHQTRIWNRMEHNSINMEIWNSKIMASMIEKFSNSPLMQKRMFINLQNIKIESPLRMIFTLMAIVDQINGTSNYSDEILKLCEQNDEFFEDLINPTL